VSDMVLLADLVGQRVQVVTLFYAIVAVQEFISSGPYSAAKRKPTSGDGYVLWPAFYLGPLIPQHLILKSGIWIETGRINRAGFRGILRQRLIREYSLAQTVNWQCQTLLASSTLFCRHHPGLMCFLQGQAAFQALAWICATARRLAISQLHCIKSTLTRPLPSPRHGKVFSSK
jgi:hypothetical protein